MRGHDAAGRRHGLGLPRPHRDGPAGPAPRSGPGPAASGAPSAGREAGPAGSRGREPSAGRGHRRGPPCPAALAAGSPRPGAPRGARCPSPRRSRPSGDRGSTPMATQKTVPAGAAPPGRPRSAPGRGTGWPPCRSPPGRPRAGAADAGQPHVIGRLHGQVVRAGPLRRAFSPSTAESPSSVKMTSPPGRSIDLVVRVGGDHHAPDSRHLGAAPPGPARGACRRSAAAPGPSPGRGRRPGSGRGRWRSPRRRGPGIPRRGRPPGSRRGPSMVFMSVKTTPSSPASRARRTTSRGEREQPGVCRLWTCRSMSMGAREHGYHVQASRRGSTRRNPPRYRRVGACRGLTPALGWGNDIGGGYALEVGAA